jgi:ABC-2 type transport system permease protein
MSSTSTVNSTSTITAPAQPPTALATAGAYASRTIRQFVRTPQLLVVGALTSVMFLLIFRYVFGGAIDTGPIAYVDFLIPALAAASGLFASGATGVAEDADSGLFDRLRSLPVPRTAVLLGRSLADTALVMWSVVVTVVVGFAVGFRIGGSAGEALAALALCALFAGAFSWLMIYLGLISGNAQAAQGISFSVFPLIFVSSAYVPVASMPGWMQPIAEHQPVTAMVGAVRALTIGGDAEAVLGHSTTWYVTRSVLWSVAIVVVFATLSTRRFARS